MKYEIVSTKRFKKDLKKAIKRNLDIALLDSVVGCLENGLPLEAKHRDHDLGGDWLGFRECHITPDWLLIYRIEADALVLVLSRTGSHANLLKK